MRFLPEGPSFCAGRQEARQSGRQAAGKEAGMQAGRQAEQPWSPEDVPSRLLPIQHVTSLFIEHTLL